MQWLWTPASCCPSAHFSSGMVNKSKKVARKKHRIRRKKLKQKRRQAAAAGRS